MKIKLDENLPLRLVSRLTALKHDVQTAREEGLTGARDVEVWEAAQREERFLITQDLDFSDIRRFVPGTHGGILLVRLQNPSRQVLIQRIESLFRSEDVTTWSGCFVEVARLGSALVAYSGGVDSAYLAGAARQAHGNAEQKVLPQ